MKNVSRIFPILGSPSASEYIKFALSRYTFSIFPNPLTPPVLSLN